MFWNRRMFWNVRPMPGRDHVVGPRAPDDRRTAAGGSGTTAAGRSPAASTNTSSPIAIEAGDPERPSRSLAAPRSEPDRAAAIADGSDPQDGLEPDPPRAARSGRRSLELDRARGRVDDPGDDVEERRLAGAVGPDDADDRALRDDEVDVADGDQAAEAAGDAIRVEQDLGVDVGTAGASARPARPCRPRSSGTRSALIRAPPRADRPSRRSRRPPRCAARAAAGGSGTGPRAAAASSRPARCRTAGTGTG